MLNNHKNLRIHYLPVRNWNILTLTFIMPRGYNFYDKSFLDSSSQLLQHKILSYQSEHNIDNSLRLLVSRFPQIGRINLSIATLPAALEVCAGSRLVDTGMSTARILMDIGTCSATSVFTTMTGNVESTLNLSDSPVGEVGAQILRTFNFWKFTHVNATMFLFEKLNEVF